MKKIIIIIILTILTNIYAIDNIKYVSAKSGLRLREGPDTSTKIILTIPYNEKVSCIEEKNKIVQFENIPGKWTKVRYKKSEGWVFGGFLKSKIVLEKEIIKAVIFANSLEITLYENKEKIESREQVYKHFRQGFIHELAQNLTDYSWSGSSLLSHDFATWPPDEIDVHIISISGIRVKVYYKTPEVLQSEDLWGMKKYSIDELVLEDDKWIIEKSSDTDDEPQMNN